MNRAMSDLPCRRVQADEIWAYVRCHQRRIKPGEDDSDRGDFYTFVAIDQESKVVPTFRVGKRDLPNTMLFIEDLSSRLATRLQLTTDSLNTYAFAVENAFGYGVDYGQLVKAYETGVPTGKYSPPEFVGVQKVPMFGAPRIESICTSHVEAQNLTMRMHVRRLTRLTNAYSKRLENFKAAIGLHFGYYNFVKVHHALRCTPAMACGVAESVWTVKRLIEEANSQSWPHRCSGRRHPQAARLRLAAYRECVRRRDLPFTHAGRAGVVQTAPTNGRAGLWHYQRGDGVSAVSDAGVGEGSTGVDAGVLGLQSQAAAPLGRGAEAGVRRLRNKPARGAAEKSGRAAFHRPAWWQRLSTGAA
jgi:hypothetical protein